MQRCSKYHLFSGPKIKLPSFCYNCITYWRTIFKILPQTYSALQY